MLPSLPMQTTCEGIRRSAGLEALALVLGSGIASKTRSVVGCMHGKVARNGVGRWQNWVKPIREGRTAMTAGLPGMTRGGEREAHIRSAADLVRKQLDQSSLTWISSWVLNWSWDLGPWTLDLGPRTLW